MNLWLCYETIKIIYRKSENILLVSLKSFVSFLEFVSLLL